MVKGPTRKAKLPGASPSREPQKLLTPQKPSKEVKHERTT
jgi:hypothetical protein